MTRAALILLALSACTAHAADFTRLPNVEAQISLGRSIQGALRGPTPEIDTLALSVRGLAPAAQAEAIQRRVDELVSFRLDDFTAGRVSVRQGTRMAAGDDWQPCNVAIAQGGDCEDAADCYALALEAAGFEAEFVGISTGGGKTQHIVVVGRKAGVEVVLSQPGGRVGTDGVVAELF